MDVELLNIVGGGLKGTMTTIALDQLNTDSCGQAPRPWRRQLQIFELIEIFGSEIFGPKRCENFWKTMKKMENKPKQPKLDRERPKLAKNGHKLSSKR